jgi:CRP-like cAMP-binding protein
VVQNLRKGQHFGEMAIFKDGVRPNNYIQAKTICILSQLKRDDFDRVMLTYPSLRHAFEDKGDQVTLKH